MFGEDAGAAAREKIGLVILNKIKSFLELFHAKHWICAHAVCGDDDIAADSIKIFLFITKQENLIRLKWDEVLVDNTFVQRA